MRIKSASVQSQRPALLVLAAVALVVAGLVVGSVIRPLGSDGQRAPDAASVDVGFAQDMIVHHQQAVQLANIAMAGTQDPAIKNLAFDVSSTQQVQIGQMQGWLALWGQPLIRTGAYMGWMSGAAMAPMNAMAGMQQEPGGGMAAMPGMASPAELSSLRAGVGPQQDSLFLQLLLRHHQGGAQMLSYAAERAADPVVRRFAAQVAASQGAESATVGNLLSERGVQALPMGG